MLAVVLCLPGARAGEPAPRKASLDTFLQRLGYGVIPLQRGQANNLFVNAKVDGKKAVLLVDTGASLLTLDRHLASKLKTVGQLGVELVDPLLGGKVEPDAILIRELDLGPARFPNQPADPTPLKPSGFPCDGILGCDFFIRQHAIIDCAGKRLFVRGDNLGEPARGALKAGFEQGGYHQAPLKRTRRLVLTCQGKINKIPLELLVDTGAVYTMIDDDIADRSHVLWSETEMEMKGIGKRGGARLWSGTPDVFEVSGAPILYPGLSIGKCDLATWDAEENREGADKSENIEGILGSELLARSSAVIDFGMMNLWFFPPEKNSK